MTTCLSPIRLPPFPSSSQPSSKRFIFLSLSPLHYPPPSYFSPLLSPPHPSFHSADIAKKHTRNSHFSYVSSRARLYEDETQQSYSFEEAVELFNGRDYYRCHDVLEHLWNEAQDPIRTLIHGILQCAVGFHHLFNQNHKGAMMELGEGLCKLRKMNFESGPFHEFEREISAVLDFVYQTQIELAACTDDLCLTMDQTERSYQLLGGYAAGQRLYRLAHDPEEETMYIIFCLERAYCNNEPQRVKLPTLHATEEHITAYR